MPSHASLIELLDEVRRGETSCSTVAQEALERAQASQPALNAFVCIHHEAATIEAAVVDHWPAGEGALRGVPVAIKDNFAEAGVACAAGSAAYADHVPLQDARVVSMLRDAGAVIVGRTGMNELADGVTGENPHFGPVANPWREGFLPGGSSAGSAAAVAAGVVPAALGTDTGGSVRIPAALCGVVGFKPTTGWVSTEGVVPLSTTLDHVGPITRCVIDASLVLDVIAGGSPHRQPGTLDGERVRIGVIEGFAADAEPAMARCFDDALRLLEGQGCALFGLNVPRLSTSLRTLAAIYQPEAAQFHAQRLAERPSEFGDLVRADLERGAGAEPQRHRDALKQMDELVRDIALAADGVDLLACPTTPHPARPFGSPDPHLYLSFTCPFNLTGQPAISVPMGLVDGLPVGLQLIGAQGADGEVLEVAERFERTLGFDATPA
jgi:aspartyl-tRNA(Asn)/glutamyl-tRNA(Gln) amidotransferase subunit A